MVPAAVVAVNFSVKAALADPAARVFLGAAEGPVAEECLQGAEGWAVKQ